MNRAFAAEAASLDDQCFRWDSTPFAEGLVGSALAGLGKMEAMVLLGQQGCL